MVASRYDNSQSLPKSWLLSNDTITCLCGLLLWPTQQKTQYLLEQDQKPTLNSEVPKNCLFSDEVLEILEQF